MPEASLSKRPRGVRKHWKAEQVTNLAVCGEFVRRSLLPPSWGDPVEARRYSYRGIIKRYDCLFSTGRVFSISYLALGRRKIRFSRA